MNTSSPFYAELRSLYHALLSKYGWVLTTAGTQRNLLFSALIAAAVATAVLVLVVALMPAKRKVVRKRKVRRVRRAVPVTRPQGVEAAAEPAKAARAKTPKLGREARVAISAAFWTVAIVATFVVTYVVTGTDQFCSGSCHVGDHHVEAAMETHHAPCIACHETNPASGLISRVSMAVAHGAGRQPSSELVENPQLCLRCHSAILAKSVTTKKGLIVSHKEILAGGRTCRDCHGDVGHAKATVAIVGGMSACTGCHDSVKAKGTCETCHTGGSPLTVSTLATRAYSTYTYGTAYRVANKDCGRCHGAETECRNCHNGFVLPHPAAFVQGGHARIAAFEGKQRCMKCHTLTWCGNDRCHQAFSAHNPQIWRTGHQTGTSEQCGSCHMSWDKRTSFCKVCH